MTQRLPHGFLLSRAEATQVYKVAAAYAVVGGLLFQLTSILFPTFDAPPWVMKVVVVAIILGFPVTLIFAWAFEITPEGIKRAEDVSPNASITHLKGKATAATGAAVSGL